MSYLDRNAADKTNRTIALATVAGIHGLVLYGLMTGLGGSYVEKVGAILTAKNYPVELPPPPPKVEPDKLAPKADTKMVALQPPIVLPAQNQPEFEKTMLLPPILGPIEPQISKPIVEPTPAFVETYKPRSAKPRNAPGSWVSTDDYPTAELRNGMQGTVSFEVAIGADGKVEGCRITSSSGSPGLDAATCRYVTRRARFEPATDASGARVAGTYSSRVTWFIPNN